jgi:hypothetical protein
MPERIMLCFSPADDVTDLDEWFASLDRALSLGRDGEWHADAGIVTVEVPADHVTEVVRDARRVLGDAVCVRNADEPLVLDAEGRAFDE